MKFIRDEQTNLDKKRSEEKKLYCKYKVNDSKRDSMDRKQ